jgi:hypothetical protein
MVVELDICTRFRIYGIPEVIYVKYTSLLLNSIIYKE